MARLHEHQGKKLLDEAGVLVPKGQIGNVPDGARTIAEEIGRAGVVKAQV